MQGIASNFQLSSKFALVAAGLVARRGRTPQKPRSAPLRASLPTSDAPGTIRTCDLCLRRAALYPLSYGRAAT